MRPTFEIIVLSVPTTSLQLWVSRFSQLSVENLKEGILARAWPDLRSWLKSAPSGELGANIVKRLESESREIDKSVLEATISQDLSCLYSILSTTELEAFLWSSLKYDELPLAVLPARCSDTDMRTILSTVDTQGFHNYGDVACSARWFITVNAEDSDDWLVCVATKDSELAELVRNEFKKEVLGPERLKHYG